MLPDDDIDKKSCLKWEGGGGELGQEKKNRA